METSLQSAIYMMKQAIETYEMMQALNDEASMLRIGATLSNPNRWGDIVRAEHIEYDAERLEDIANEENSSAQFFFGQHERHHS